MRLLKHILHDVREGTDNEDTNGVSDKELVRYARDFVRSVQAIVYKNNPLCAYFQGSTTLDSPLIGTEYDLPSDCYADNAVTFVEVRAETSVLDKYSPLERVWPEDQNSFRGYFIRNKKIVFTGGLSDTPIGYSVRIWYFKRTPMWDKEWAKVVSVLGSGTTITVSDADMWDVDNYITIQTPAGNRFSEIKFTKTGDTEFECINGADLTQIQADDSVLMGKNSTLELDFPEECETYALDYISKRLTARNNYAESLKAAEFSDEAKGDLIAIFAEAAQTQTRAPLTDTGFLRI